MEIMNNLSIVTYNSFDHVIDMSDTSRTALDLISNYYAKEINQDVGSLSNVEVQENDDNYTIVYSGETYTEYVHGVKYKGSKYHNDIVLMTCITVYFRDLFNDIKKELLENEIK